MATDPHHIDPTAYLEELLTQAWAGVEESITWLVKGWVLLYPGWKS